MEHNLRNGGQSPLIDRDEGERLTKSSIGSHSLVGKGRGGRTTRWGSFDDAGSVLARTDGNRVSQKAFEGVYDRVIAIYKTRS